MSDGDNGLVSLRLMKVADDDYLLNIGRKAVEDTLIEFRDRRISVLGRGNGLVVKEPDGTESSVIRLGTEEALRIGMRAIAEHLTRQPSPAPDQSL